MITFQNEFSNLHAVYMAICLRILYDAFGGII